MLDSTDIGIDPKTGKKFTMTLIDSLPGDYWWSSYISGYRFVEKSGKSVDYAIETVKNKVFTDSASTCNYIPEKYFHAFGKLLGAYASTFIVDGKLGYLIDCEKQNQMPDVFFNIGGIWF